MTTLAAALLCGAIAFGCGSSTEGGSPPQSAISDEYVLRADALAEDRTPPEPDPASYGMDPETGRFVYPAATPHQHESKPFEGQLDYWDTNEYAKAMTVEAYYPITVEPFHTWQNIVDFDGRRYMYQYVRRALKIYDITDPKDLKVVHEKGSTWIHRCWRAESLIRSGSRPCISPPEMFRGRRAAPTV